MRRRHGLVRLQRPRSRATIGPVARLRTRRVDKRYRHELRFERHKERARDEQFRHLKGELIDPNVAHFLQHGDILDAAQLLKDLELDGSKLFCLPVNDETDLSLHVGGCHWSLLVHTPAVTADIPARWSHIDSMSHKNIPHAEKMAKQIAKGLFDQRRERVAFFVHLLRAARGVQNNNFEVELFSLEDTPQQKNGHDCGIFVIELACKIVDFGVEWEIDEDFDMHDIDARGWRKETSRYRIFDRRRRRTVHRVVSLYFISPKCATMTKTR